MFALRIRRSLVAGEGHPLGQHVVGVGQPRLRDRAGQVRELDAVLAEQPPGLRDVGDDRLVRVDQVRVRGRRPAGARALAPRASWKRAGAGEPAVDADEAEVAVHRPLLVVDARAQELAGALLGAALAAGIAEVGAARRAPGATACGRARRSFGRAQARERGRQQDRGDEGEDEEREQHGRAAQPPAARGKKITRSASVGMSA